MKGVKGAWRGEERKQVEVKNGTVEDYYSYH